MTPYEKHIKEIKRVEKEIENSKGFHRNDLIRYWQRLEKDRVEYLSYMKEKK